MWATVGVVVEASVELFVTQKGAEEGSCTDNSAGSADAVFCCFGQGLICHKHLQGGGRGRLKGVEHLLCKVVWHPCTSSHESH